MSIFKDSFEPNIQGQLRARQKAIGDTSRSSTTIQYFNSRNAWIRMTSAVDYNKSSGLANSYVLLGGTLSGGNLRSGKGAYSSVTPHGTSHKLGTRLMPGITSIEVKSKAAYGSLREIVVNFQCWDIRQLEELELLYMRPGYSALVEWGWSPYLTNAGGLKNATSFTNSVLNGGVSKENIWEDLFDKASNTSEGNYDAMYGFIKNYNWSARPDGGYDCSTTIITMGEIIESLKINYGAFTINNLPTTGLFGGVPPPPPPNNLLTAITAIALAGRFGTNSGFFATLANLFSATPNNIYSAYSQNIIPLK